MRHHTHNVTAGAIAKIDRKSLAIRFGSRIVMAQRETAAMTDLKALSLKLEDAMQAYATEAGDGFGNLDHLGARDFRDDGYKVAECVFSVLSNPSDCNARVEGLIEEFEPFGRDVIAAAAWYRLAELSA